MLWSGWSGWSSVRSVPSFWEWPPDIGDKLAKCSAVCKHRVVYIRTARMKGVTKHCTACTALKYGAASCGEEYTTGYDHVGFNWISRKPSEKSRGRTDEGAKRPVTRRSRLLAVRWAGCARWGFSWHRYILGQMFRETPIPDMDFSSVLFFTQQDSHNVVLQRLW